MAFPMDLKVVKVGDIGSPREEQINLLYDPATESDDDLQEKGGAPENWPPIPQLSRPRSCEACGERTNCVNKAVEHLQILLDILSDWIQKTDKKEAPKDTVNQMLSITDCDHKDGQRALVPLETDLVSARCVESLKDFNSHFQLKTVVKEVMSLLIWLHEDCQKTEAKLFSAIDENKKLYNEINRMFQQKLIDMKERVQIEHDIPKKKSSKQQIMVLKTVLAIKKQKLRSEHFFNSCIRKEIAIRFSRIPLVQDKMIEEKREIDVFQTFVNEAEELIEETLEVQPKTTFQYNETLQIVRKEENLINQQVNEVSHEFNMLTNAAYIAKTEFYIMTKDIAESKEKLEKLKRELMEMRVILENTKSRSVHSTKDASTEMTNLVHKMKTKIIRMSEEENRQAEIENMRKEYDTKLEKLQKLLSENEAEYKILFDANNKKSDAVQSLNAKSEISKSRKGYYENSLKRLNNELTKMEFEIEFVAFELSKNQEENKKIIELAEESQKYLQEYEASLMSKTAALAMKISAEDEHFLELSNSVNFLEYQLRDLKVEAAKEKKKFEKKTNTIRGSVEKINDKSERLSLLKCQKIEALGRLTLEKERLAEKHQQTIKANEEYLKNLKPYRHLSVNKCKEIEDKIEELLQDQEQLIVDKAVLLEQHKIVEEDLVKNEEAIGVNNDHLEQIIFRTEMAEKHHDDANDRWDQVGERLRKEKEEHTDLMSNRKETLQEILQKKEEGLILNEQLATEHRRTKDVYVQRKTEFLQLSEDTAMLQRALRDLKQLWKVQEKMLRSNTGYLEMRGVWHKSKLADFVSTSKGSVRQFNKLKTEYYFKVNRITANLEGIGSSMVENERRFFPKITQGVLPKINQTSR